MAETRTFSNPIVPGFAPDPSVVFVHGVFYLATSSFHVFPGIPIYASTDLQEWKHISNAINRQEQLSLARASTAVMPLDTGNVMVASAGLFAPTIRYHEGIFYIVCTNAIRGDGGRLSLDNFYVSTDDIWSGSWSDPIHFPFAGIDPSIFFDNDGKTYIQGCWMVDRLRQPSCTIKQLEIDIGTGEVLQEAREIWGGFARYDTEGPHVYKRDGWYYLLVAEGGTFEHHLLSIGRSRSIWGPYESCPANPIMTADRKPEEYIQNIGHGELFQGHNGTWWAAVLGVRSEEGGPPLGRETFLTGVDWPEGGWPVVQQPRMEFSRSLPGPVGGGEMKASPDGVDYVYIRDHDPERYDFRGKGEDKFYTLRPSAAGLSAQSITATFVGKRQRSLDASASVTLDLTGGPHSKPVKAGLALYKDGLRHVSLAYDFAAAQLVYDVTTTSKEKCQTASIPLDSRPKAISFLVSTSAKEYRFSYRVADTKEWVEAGSAQVADLVAREMTGPIFGIFAHTNDSETTGQQVTFTKFTLEGQKNLIW